MDEKDMLKQIHQKIADADMILVGLGEEFDCMGTLRQNETYIDARKQLEEGDAAWLLPLLNRVYGGENYQGVQERLAGLADLLADKNYFVVSTSVNDGIRNVNWREKRLVMPCGGAYEKQCVKGCAHTIQQLSEVETETLSKLLQKQGNIEFSKVKAALGTCQVCGEELVLNNVYTENYDESGYLEQWEWYTKWLQGTLNKNLLILELGVTMQCPSVIRWPFEKVAYFNQKAYMCRVNEKLYHLTEELKGKGVGISQNAIDWLQLLC